MSDKPQLALARTEVELGEQLGAVKHIDHMATMSLADLGEAYLEHEEAMARLGRAEKSLRRAEGFARRVAGERAVIMRALVEELKLPPGEWTFDAEKGTLVMKEAQDGQPS